MDWIFSVEGSVRKMKSYRIDRDLTVTELHTGLGRDGDWMTEDVVWADLPYDDRNVVIYDDEAFKKPGLAFVRIGENARVPVPAYIIGFKGETRIDSDLDASDIKVAFP